MRTNRFAILALAALCVAFPLAAQSEDDLFGDEEIVTVAENADSTNAVDTFLVSETVRVGGAFTGNLNLSEQINDPWNSGFNFFSPDTHGMSTGLQSLLFFDARPQADRRYYLSLKVLWPFYDETSVLTGAQYVPAAIPFIPEPDVKTQSTTVAMPQVKQIGRASCRERV